MPMAQGHDRGSFLLLDIAAVFSLWLASLLVYASVLGPEPSRSPPPWYSPALSWLAVGFLLLIAVLALYSGSRPSLAKANGGFVLLRRRLFGKFRVKERIPSESVAKAQSVSARRVKFGEERPPLVRLELVDGRRFRFSRPQVGDETYAALAALADRQRSLAN